MCELNILIVTSSAHMTVKLGKQAPYQYLEDELLEETVFYSVYILSIFLAKTALCIYNRKTFARNSIT